MAETVRPQSDRPRTSVVIAARDAGSTIGEALRAVLDQRGVDEVVVAVGPSRDRTRDVAASTGDERVVVVDNPAGNTPAGLNRALATSDGDVVVRVDAHAILPDGYIERAVTLLRDSGAANVGGRQVPTAQGGVAGAIATAMRSPAGSGGAAYRHAGEVRDADTVYLGVFDRAALEAVGGFDETMIRNQDAELNERLRRHGHRIVFDPGLAVAYHPRTTWSGLARQYFGYGRYRRRTVQLHPGSLRARQAAPAIMVLALAGTAAIRMLARVRTPLRLTVVGYTTAVVAAGFHADRRDPLRVALALAIMHLSWGVGFLVGPPRGTTGR